jgi:multifunctional 2-oxoglutarate metabolism enzyme
MSEASGSTPLFLSASKSPIISFFCRGANRTSKVHGWARRKASRSGLAKWGQTSRLTLLLPHGYEGSGPEHSSARLERFLQLAAEGNIRVANPTTPAQYFHLLRRHARIAKQRPLIIMTPKSLLRLPQASDHLEHLVEGQFHPVLAEPGIDDDLVTRLLLCTGKIYYEIVVHSERVDNERVAVGRVDLLYTFPEAQFVVLIARYPNLE